MDLAKNSTLQNEDQFVLYLDRNQFYLFQLTQEWYFDTSFGRFLYEDLIGKQFGSKVMSKNQKGFGFILKVTPEFFTLLLKQNTQILYFPDISQVILNLELQKGSYVIESGTGSGSMTYSLSTKVGKMGKIFTFEYNQQRAEAVTQIFEKMKIENIINVMNDGFYQEKMGDKKIDAVFLDLPQPYGVIDLVCQVLRKDGKFSSFSPCIEQIQKTAQQLAKKGFCQIKIIECLEREYNKKCNSNQDPFTKRSEKYFSYQMGKMEDKGHTGYLIFARYLL